MAMVDLAKHNDENQPTSLSAIAIRQDISLPYLEQLFSKLRRSGLVKSVRGPHGGYFLAAPAIDIKVSQIIDAADEEINIAACAGADGINCSKLSHCHTTTLWRALADHIDSFLVNVTLEDLRDGNPLNHLFAVPNNSNNSLSSKV